MFNKNVDITRNKTGIVAPLANEANKLFSSAQSFLKCQKNIIVAEQKWIMASLAQIADNIATDIIRAYTIRAHRFCLLVSPRLRRQNIPTVGCIDE